MRAYRYSISVLMLRSATASTLPPSPPSPPSGPPRGTYFSRRKLQQPRPPWPPLTYRVTRSTNIQRSIVRGGELFFLSLNHTARAYRQGDVLGGFRLILPHSR